MKIVNSEEMQLIDIKTQKEFEYPALLLMENAGINCYAYLKKNIFPIYGFDKTVFVCGKGNNGGDAFVMARHHFIDGFSGAIILMDTPHEGTAAATNFILCKNLGIKILNFNSDREEAVSLIKKSSLIIDGISGTGIKGSFTGIEAEVCEIINESSAFVCSLDVPSGIGDNYKSSHVCVTADLTITIGLPKISLYYPAARKHCGTIVFADAAFPPAYLKVQRKSDDSAKPDITLINKNILNKHIKLPAAWSHKNSRGHAAVFAGSKGKSGAAALCSKAALRSLAGVVTLFTDADVYTPLASSLSSIMVDIFDSAAAKNAVEKSECCVLGPGWGFEKEKEDFLEYLLESANKPLVIDADAITLLSAIIEKQKEKNKPFYNKNCIITPHPGEFARLTKSSTEEIMDNPVPLIKSFSEQTGIIVVLKSHVTWICNNHGKIAIFDSMNPGLATAGSGDILAGIIGGLLAYGLTPFEAAICGVVIHGNAGKKCHKRKGFFAAEDILEYIPIIIKDIKKQGKNAGKF
ncbi:MAG: NAD(P)H-hydrate dehydratase [Spirochaetes bacterium]|nr:NAD(P)H-hydrate dehydratase [Spirochaetota bacterium]